MSKYILKSKTTEDYLIVEGNISSVTGNWEIINLEENSKNGSSKKNGNGQGSLYFSDTLQKWVGQYTTKDGKRKTMTQKNTEGINEFKKRYRETLASVDNGTYIEKSRETLYEILERYIEQKFKDGITSPRSYQRNKETLKEIESTCSKFVNKPIQKISIEDIEDSKEYIKQYSSETIDKIWGMLKSGFRVAFSRRKIQFNIMDDITLKKPISEKKTIKKEALTLKEEKKLRKILNNEEKEHEYRDIVLLQLNTGMRIGEVLARVTSDFDKKQSTLHIWNTLTQDESYNITISEHTKIYDKKNQIDKGERTIPLDAECQNILLKIAKSNMKNIHNLFFWDYKNNCLINYAEINSWLRRLNTKYKISNKSLSTHLLRHTRITRLQEANVSLPVIQYLVGHVEGSNVTNDVYTSVSSDFVNNELKKVK